MSAPNPQVLPTIVRQHSVTFSQNDLDQHGLLDAAGIPEDMRGAAPKRQLEFLLGRMCAREAMRNLGAGVQQVARNQDGSPRWPVGISGSITHAEGFAAAAVAWVSDVSAIGIDTERVMTEERARAVRDVVALPIELAQRQSVGLTQLEALTLVFSAKETIFKCLYPTVRRIFDFHDVRVVDIDTRTRTFRARLARSLAPTLRAQMALEGRFDIDARGVHTGMALALRG